MDINPAIVVIAYNRPVSIARLLSSLKSARYSNQNISLIISIDYENSANHAKVIKIASDFEWPFGNKIIIDHERNLGLREHVLTCGDLVKDYESIIMLEDDIFVSPYFYDYASKALGFYQNADEIGGISLYTHRKNFLTGLPFELIPDSNDVYFLQIASSWGQAWTKKQWFDFRNWMVNIDEKSNWSKLPSAVRSWPKSSWLKYFIKYLHDNNKYFVYPNKSLTTNFGDSGTHNKKDNREYQVPLSMGNYFNFFQLEESINVYDAFFEILPSRLKLLAPGLKHLDFSVDLYGKKELKNITTEYLISSKRARDKYFETKTFGLDIKPMVLNIVYEIPGNVFKIDLKKAFFDDAAFFSPKTPLIFNYFYSNVGFTNLLAVAFNKIKSRLKK